MSEHVNPVKNPERLKPIPPADLLSRYGEVFKALPGTLFQGKETPVNVFGVLAHRAEISKYFFPYWVQSKKLLDLTFTDQELIILRMACLYGSSYVWGHHSKLLKEIDFPDEKLAQLPLPVEEASWSQKEAALLTVVDQLVKEANISEENWKEITRYYSKEQILDIITVVSQYLLFCAVNNVFGVKIELSNPLPFPGE